MWQTLCGVCRVGCLRALARFLLTFVKGRWVVISAISAWPHLDKVTDPAVLRAELAVVRVEYNTVRLHAGIGYVTPDDEHEGRGPQIRRARRVGLMRARRQRITYHRLQHRQNQPPESR